MSLALPNDLKRLREDFEAAVELELAVLQRNAAAGDVRCAQLAANPAALRATAVNNAAKRFPELHRAYLEAARGGAR